MIFLDKLEKKKRTRNRSIVKKEIQLRKIIEKGRELYLKDGSQMSMRELARQLELVVSGLYRYVQNKRELWFACIDKDFKNLSKELDEIESEHKGNDLDLLQKIGTYFLQLSQDNFPLFKFMFLTEPPSSNKEKGPFELQCSKFGFSNLINIISRAIKSGEISKTNPLLLSLTIWGFVLGPAIISSPMFAYFFEDVPTDVFNIDVYHSYVLSSLKRVYEKEN